MNLKEQIRNHKVKIFGIIGIVGGIAIGILPFEIMNYRLTGHWNPKKQFAYFNREAERAEIEGQIKREEQKRYEDLYNEVFRLADKNNDGTGFHEIVDAYKRMGNDEVFIEGRSFDQFPKPSIEDLERAIESYKEE